MRTVARRPRPFLAALLAFSLAAGGAAPPARKPSAGPQGGRLVGAAAAQEGDPDRGPWFDVTAAGAVGDGVADDTRAVRSAIEAAKASRVNRVVYFPGGTYRISDKLTVDAAQITFLGSNRETTVIKQSRANTPILYWSNDLNGSAHSVNVRHLGFDFSDAPTADSHQQYAVQFRADPTGTRFSGGGFFLCSFEDIFINNSYVGIGAYSVKTGSCPIWSSRFENIRFRNTKHHAIKLSNATPVGQPHNTISHCDILNNGFVSDGEAVRGDACTGCVIDHLNVEDWYNGILWFMGGSYLTVNGLRTERHHTSGLYPKVVYIANGVGVLNGVELNVCTDETGYASLIVADAGAQVTVNGVVAGQNVEGSTTNNTMVLLSGEPASGSRITANSLKLYKNVDEYLPSKFGNGLYARVNIDGLPPGVDRLPPPGPGYRGRVFAVDGGDGAADALFRCEKTASGKYVWRPL